MAQGDRYHSGKWGWFSKKDKPKKTKRSKPKKSRWWNRIELPEINFPNINMDWLLSQTTLDKLAQVYSVNTRQYKDAKSR